MLREFCSLLVINQTIEQAVSSNYYYWTITTMKPSKLHVVCLTSLYYIKIKFPIDIIHVPDACKAYTNTLFLSARNSLSKKKVLGNQQINPVTLTWNTLMCLILPWFETLTFHL